VASDFATMANRVVVLGGGVGGLSTAQELAERGFEVEVFESRPVWGGKARSLTVAGTGQDRRKDLPGEHGFRFFPSFYKHLPDTMKRIPFGTNANGVFDNLVYARRVEIARAGKYWVIEPARFPQTLDDWLSVLGSLFTPLGIPAAEVTFFVDRLLLLLTTCPERRLAEYENIAWWDFIDAKNKSEEYQHYLGQGLTRSLVAMRAEVSSLRTVGYILLQLFLGFLTPRGFDRLLNSPTNDAWINPWVQHLTQHGVRLHGASPVKSINLKGRSVESVTVEQAGQPAEVTADYYVAAVPVEVMSRLATDAIKSAAPSLANLEKLETRWMNGIQFYLSKDVPLIPGHVNFVDSPWALTSISQHQFWNGLNLTDYGDGGVGGILSVVISDWQAPGVVYGRPAMQLTAEEIKNEVWEQMKSALDVDGARQLEDANLITWFLDPDIQFPNPTTVANLEPLLINTVGSLQDRPEAHTEISNLYLASDYVRTYTDIATMEAANEAARRAANAILDAAGSAEPRCGLWPFEEPEVFKPLQEYDRLRFKLGLPHGKI
jgi:15-cis-phytoene desaturase